MLKSIPLSNVNRLSIVLLIGFLLTAPSLFTGLFADDYWHYFAINNPTFSSLTNKAFFLFHFLDEDPAFLQFLMNTGSIPWWTDPDLRLVLFRPVAEITHYLDYLVLGKNTFLMHLHSLAWYGVLICALYCFYRNISASRAVALLSLLVFVSSPFHAFAVSWLANRNAIMAGAFSLICFNLYYTFYNTKDIRYQLASLLFFALALLSAEISTTIAAFIAIYLWVICKEPFHNVISRLTPFILIFIAWFSYYKLSGYGASGGSNFRYYDPVSNPVAYFKSFIEIAPRALAAELTLLSALFKSYQMKVYAIAIGYALGAILLFIILRTKNRNITFYFLCAITSAIPISSSFFIERNLVFTAMVCSPLIAMLILFLWNSAGKMKPFLAVVLFTYHVIFSGALTLYASYLPKIYHEKYTQATRSLPQSIHNKQLVIFGIPDLQASLIYYLLFFEEKPLPKSIWNITPENIKASLYRKSENEFLVSAPDGLLRQWEMYRNYRDENIFNIGESIKLQNANIVINAIDNKGNPSEISLVIDNAHTQNLLFLKWEGHQLNAFEIDIDEKISL